MIDTTPILLSTLSQKALDIGRAIARENLHANIMPAHLLMGLLHKDVMLEPLLTGIDADVYYIRDWAEVRMEGYPKTTSVKETILISDDIGGLLDEAENIRMLLNENEISPLHLMAAICTPGVAFSFDKLRTFPLKREDILNAGQPIQPTFKEILNSKENGENRNAVTGTQPALQKYCTDKTTLAQLQEIDPIIGREQEMRVIEAIFGRRLKPNVMIVGEPGVGKSALVDGFAIAIAEKRVPQFLQSSRIYELNTGALIAGASYKGEIEERLNNIISELKKQDKAILFIDEIHTFFDKNGGVANAANLLKPELARGSITLIGATTIDEYRKQIEPDEAFARRFELLHLEEPDVETVFRMIKGTAHLYEKHHLINLPDETIKESIRLAKRYVKDRKLPDAAIDLIDRTMATLRLSIETSADIIKRHHQLFKNLSGNNQASTEDYRWHHAQLKDSLNPILWYESVIGEDTEGPDNIEQFRKLISDIYSKLANPELFDRDSLLPKDIAAMVADKTGIPIGKIQSGEKERLLNMAEILKSRVVGQDYAISTVSESIMESRAGLGRPGQPIGSFFFLGPTGTGKTELAKSLAELLFQSESNIIRFDMSEFKEEHAAALLYGSPPGYVGYEEGGLLVNKIREKPYSIVLFDEIEKAHQSVFDVFLQIMDEGKLHDKLGKEGDFSNALILFTSNIGSNYITEQIHKGQLLNHVQLMELMGNYFRPEFLGRLTEIVPFCPMTQEMVENIFSIQMKSLLKALEKEKIQLTITEMAKKKLSLLGFTPQFGARPLNGVIRDYIRRPLAKKIISGQLPQGSRIALDISENEEFIWRNN